MAQLINAPQLENQGWGLKMLGVLQAVGGVVLDAAAAAGGVCKDAGAQLGLVGCVVLVLGLGHMVLLWRVLQLLSVLIEKLDRPSV
jgi:hypothetical protein